MPVRSHQAMQKRLSIIALVLGVVGAAFVCLSVWRVERCFSDGGVTLGFPKPLDTWYWQSFGYLSFAFIAAGFIVEICVICRYDHTDHCSQQDHQLVPECNSGTAPDVQETAKTNPEVN